MKSLYSLALLFAFVSLMLIGCSDKTGSPVSPPDQNQSVSIKKARSFTRYRDQLICGMKGSIYHRQFLHTLTRTGVLTEPIL